MIRRTRLRELRIENGLTIKKLSNLLGISPSTLSRYEKTSSKIRLNTLSKLCILFNVRLDYVLFLSDIKNPTKPYRST